MDQTYILLLGLAALVAVVAAVVIRKRMQQDQDESTPADSPYATSTEGEKRCPKCGMGNMWTDRQCIACGAALKG
ncbi:MAG: hypothetical protein A2V85_18390 [Chloroflexi bacterium RBG_16_72_14]|nr:MAG: hypothetical protein A2V85_18390 [Chloroflexi bacterium RBG_16_72_14]